MDIFEAIAAQIQPLLTALIGLVLTWALGEAVRYLRAKVAAAIIDGDVARSTALEFAANAAVAAAEELAKAAEKRGEPKPDGLGKFALARSLLPAGVDERTAQRVLSAAVARTFGTGATGAQTIGRSPSVAIAPANARTGGVAALTLCLALGVAGCSATPVVWPSMCAPTKSGTIVCACKRQVVKVTRDATGTIKAVRHYCDGEPLPIDSLSQQGETQ